MLFLCFRCYGNLKFPLTYNGKSDKWPILLSHCRYQDSKIATPFISLYSMRPLTNLDAAARCFCLPEWITPLEFVVFHYHPHLNPIGGAGAMSIVAGTKNGFSI